MNCRKILFTLGVVALLSAASTFAAPPNIIFILVDDMGYGDVGAYFQNDRQAKNDHSLPWTATPNLDKFAIDGAQFFDHYCAAPVCAPSRASILLGVSQGHANVRDNQFDKALENNHTMANVLKQAGYATVAVGKWGLQGPAPPEMVGPLTWHAYPTKRGFDHFFGYVRHVDGHEHYPKEAPYFKNHQPRDVWDDEEMITAQLDKCYTADLWTAWAKRWIVEHQHTNSAQPFFMYLAYDTPHAVQELPTQEYPHGGGLKAGMQWLGTPGHMITTASGKIDSWIHPDYANQTYKTNKNSVAEVPWPNVYKRYATAVRRLDDALGDIEHLLKDLNIDDNTLVVFTSDNGPSIESYLPEPLRADFFDSYGPFDGIKRDCWEGGERVPTLARWPGHIPTGTLITRPSISYDWLRTFADAAGLPAPERLDGVSLLPELTGQTGPTTQNALGGQHDRGYIYVEYFENGRTPNYQKFVPAHRNRKREQMQLIRIGDFTGVRYDVKSQADPFEIYDVLVDPKEATNLASTLPDTQQLMKAMVLQSRRPNASAPRPYDNELLPADTGVAVTNGVVWKAFEGDYPWVPDLEIMQSKKDGKTDHIDLGKRTRDNNVGLFFTGYLKIPQDGEYTFYLKTDTGAELRIHDATVIDADFGYHGGEEVSGAIRLKQGLHQFRLYYLHKDKGAPSLDFSWSGPQIEKQAVPANVFRRKTD